MKTVTIFRGFWTVRDLTSNPRALFVFGDNDIRRGKGGQAVIRGQPNAVGLTTKKYPDDTPESFFDDDEYDENVVKISDDIADILKEFVKSKYDTLVIPQQGLGTGLSDLPKRAPETFAFLKKKISTIVDVIDPGKSESIKW